MRLHADPMLILEYFLWRTRSEYAISNHYDRHCVWEEVLQNKRLNKYNHTVIDQQFMFYQSDGLSKFNESEHSSILPSCLCHLQFYLKFAFWLIVLSNIDVVICFCSCSRRFFYRTSSYAYVKFIFLPLV